MNLQELRNLYEGSRSWATVGEVQVLFDYIKANDVQLVVEVGTCNGFAAACMALAGANVLTFDIEDKPKMYDDPKFPYPEVRSKIAFKAIPSPECFQDLTLPAGKVLFFVDGDHNYRACSRDYHLAVGIARPGDLIVLHDTYNVPDVMAFWAELTREFPGRTTTIASKNGMGLFQV